jgi:hypothetical protein
LCFRDPIGAEAKDFIAEPFLSHPASGCQDSGALLSARCQVEQECALTRRECNRGDNGQFRVEQIDESPSQNKRFRVRNRFSQPSGDYVWAAPEHQGIRFLPWQFHQGGSLSGEFP